MSTRYSPTVRRRRLSHEIKRRRLQARMTLDEAAKTAEIARTTVSNIESGEKKRPQVNEIKALLDAYQIEDEREREEILTLCRQSRERGWWARYKDVLRGSKYIGFETEASMISNWEPLVVPGLLQIPEYVELLAKTALVRDPTEIQRMVDARMERQKILREEPPELCAVFGEAALLALTEHPDVLHRQVEHLIQMAEGTSPTTLQMAPATRLNPGSAGGFAIMDFPTTVDPPVVFLETDTDGLYLEHPEEVARYRTLLGHLRVIALTPEETVERLHKMIS
ncbi:helix-turn-helix domain-containing protein [Salinactinospora qingdaonensis]|uniref:Helix-turn-helix transcriptional regulator n=1 Tax=Salinactinospora qingdaonensis TaxID=702744 RepID=A0ABP7GE91_9ACTN